MLKTVLGEELRVLSSRRSRVLNTDDLLRLWFSAMGLGESVAVLEQRVDLSVYLRFKELKNERFTCSAANHRVGNLSLKFGKIHDGRMQHGIRFRRVKLKMKNEQ